MPNQHENGRTLQAPGTCTLPRRSILKEEPITRYRSPSNPPPLSRQPPPYSRHQPPEPQSRSRGPYHPPPPPKLAEPRNELHTSRTELREEMRSRSNSLQRNQYESWIPSEPRWNLKEPDSGFDSLNSRQGENAPRSLEYFNYRNNTSPAKTNQNSNSGSDFPSKSTEDLLNASRVSPLSSHSPSGSDSSNPASHPVLRHNNSYPGRIGSIQSIGSSNTVNQLRESRHTEVLPSDCMYPRYEQIPDSPSIKIRRESGDQRHGSRNSFHTSRDTSLDRDDSRILDDDDDPDSKYGFHNSIDNIENSRFYERRAKISSFEKEHERKQRLSSGYQNSQDAENFRQSRALRRHQFERKSIKDFENQEDDDRPLHVHDLQEKDDFKILGGSLGHNSLDRRYMRQRKEIQSLTGNDRSNNIREDSQTSTNSNQKTFVDTFGKLSIKERHSSHQFRESLNVKELRQAGDESKLQNSHDIDRREQRPYSMERQENPIEIRFHSEPRTTNEPYRKRSSSSTFIGRDRNCDGADNLQVNSIPRDKQTVAPISHKTDNKNDGQNENDKKRDSCNASFSWMEWTQQLQVSS